MLNEVLKIFEICYLLIQKLRLIKTNRNKRSVVAVSFKFLQKLPSKLEMQCKKGMHVSFDVRNRLRGGVGLTAGQNPVKHDKS